MKHGLLPSLLLTALLTTTAPVLAQVAAQATAPNAAQVERIAELKKRAIEGVEARAKLAQEMNDSIFSFGELAFQEFETSKYITDILEKNGFTFERDVAGLPTGWVAKWGSGGPVIALGSDIDCIPKASQKPGVAYREAMIEGAPGHGEGHNSGQAAQRGRGARAEGDHGAGQDPRHASCSGRAWPRSCSAARPTWSATACSTGVDAVLFTHVGNNLQTAWGQPIGTGMVSVEYTFSGESAHSAMAPWRGRSALDGVELMNIGWNMRREHLRPEQRSHYVIPDGGDQPNVVPSSRNRLVLHPRAGLREHPQELRDRQHDRRSGRQDDGHDRHATGHRHGGAAPLQQADRRGRPMPTSSRSGCRNGRTDEQAFAKAVQKAVEGQGGRPRGRLKKLEPPAGQAGERRLRRHRRHLLDRADDHAELSVEHPEPARPPLVQRHVDGDARSRTRASSRERR